MLYMIIYNYLLRAYYLLRSEVSVLLIPIIQSDRFFYIHLQLRKLGRWLNNLLKFIHVVTSTVWIYPHVYDSRVCTLSHYILTISGFLSLRIIDIWGWIVIFYKGLMCTAGCSAASLL